LKSGSATERRRAGERESEGAGDGEMKCYGEKKSGRARERETGR
jgi:hypothetical protein